MAGVFVCPISSGKNILWQIFNFNILWQKMWITFFCLCYFMCLSLWFIKWGTAYLNINYMKKIFTIAAVLLTLTSFGQKVATQKAPSSVTLPLLDGLDFKNNITFKVVEPSKFDAVYGKTSLAAIQDNLHITNMFLKFEMKNKNSYKPIASPINKIMLMDFDGKTIVSVTIVVESQNGYGNKITKEYHCYTDLDGTNFKLSSY